MIRKIDHVGIVVSNLEEACRFYENVLGIKVAGTEEVTDQKVITAFLLLAKVKLNYWHLLHLIVPSLCS